MNEKKNSILQTLSITRWVLGLYFKNYPLLTFLFFACEIILQLSNIVNAYIVAIVTDMAISLTAKGSTGGVNDFIPIVTLIIGATLFFEIVRVLSNYSRRMMNFQDWFKLKQLLYEQMFVLGVSQLEKPEISNKSQRFSEETNNIMAVLEILVTTMSNLAAFIGAAAILIIRIPILAAVFAISVTLQWLINQKFIRELWIVNRDTTEERRQAISTLNMLSDPAPLKELIITRGHRYLAKKFENYFGWYLGKVRNIRQKMAGWGIFSEVIDAAGFGYGMILILQRLVGKIITVGQLTFELRSLNIFSSSFSAVANSLVNLREATIRLADVRELFTDYGADKDGERELPDIKKPPEIKIEDASFKYPGSKKLAIKGVNLIIKPGEKIAIVGENGAGKTTLVKLICRLYRINTGKILIGKHDINNLIISSWYKKLGVLFQDFNTYTHLTVNDNVEIGDPKKKSTQENIRRALGKADALGFVSKYPKGLDQILSERYKDGIRPSSGQWQKIAIGRFFYRDAPVLILDEPTASIDAIAEAQIFDNIYKFIEDKTVIIISHRFATVRNADRIIVIDNGQIIEEGTHEELLAKDGKYARAFKLQARGYQ